MNPTRFFFLCCLAAALSSYSLASHAVCFTQQCVQARNASVAVATPAPAAVPTAPAATAPAPSYSLSDDLAAATADACALDTTTNLPVDPHSCQCGTFLLSVIPNLNPSLGKVPGAITRLEQLRIIRLKLAASNLQYNFHSSCGALNMDLTADLLTIDAFIANVLAK